MTTTTSYGTWNNRVDSYSLTVEQSVVEAFGAEGPAGYDLDAIISGYRTAINNALPEGIVLAGDEFYGPHPIDVDVDLKEIIEAIDLWAIIEQHEE
jgi:hypothetical protein